MSTQASNTNQLCDDLKDIFAEMKRELFFDAIKKSNVYDFEFVNERPMEKSKRYQWEKNF